MRYDHPTFIRVTGIMSLKSVLGVPPLSAVVTAFVCEGSTSAIHNFPLLAWYIITRSVHIHNVL
jgi:hypothetical protein